MQVHETVWLNILCHTMDSSTNNVIEINKYHERNIMKKVRNTEIKTFNSTLFLTLESTV